MRVCSFGNVGERRAEHRPPHFASILAVVAAAAVSLSRILVAPTKMVQFTWRFVFGICTYIWYTYFFNSESGEQNRKALQAWWDN